MYTVYPAFVDIYCIRPISQTYILASAPTVIGSVCMPRDSDYFGYSVVLVSKTRGKKNINLFPKKKVCDCVVLAGCLAGGGAAVTDSYMSVFAALIPTRQRIMSRHFSQHSL